MEYATFYAKEQNNYKDKTLSYEKESIIILEKIVVEQKYLNTIIYLKPFFEKMAHSVYYF